MQKLKTIEEAKAWLMALAEREAKKLYDAGLKDECVRNIVLNYCIPSNAYSHIDMLYEDISRMLNKLYFERRMKRGY